MNPALRQVLLGRPGWVPRGASLALDFANARYWSGTQVRGALEALPGWSYSRSGQELAADAAGAYAAYAANVPAINSAGLAVWEARTNKSTNYNAAPTDLTGVSALGSSTLTVVTIANLPTAVRTALLAKVGAIPSAVYKVEATSTANSGIQFDGAVGNVNPHTLSAHVYVESGPAPSIRLSGAEGTVTCATDFSRTVSANVTPGTTGRLMRIVQLSGATTFYVVLNGLSEGASVTPPIIVAGASATRGAPVANVSLAGLSGTSITVDYGTASSVTFARNTLADPDILPLGAASGGAWVNNVIRRVVLR
jgi:hypothetical protein